MYHLSQKNSVTLHKKLLPAIHPIMDTLLSPSLPSRLGPIPLPLPRLLNNTYQFLRIALQLSEDKAHLPDCWLCLPFQQDLSMAYPVQTDQYIFETHLLAKIITLTLAPEQLWPVILPV